MQPSRAADFLTTQSLPDTVKDHLRLTGNLESDFLQILPLIAAGDKSAVKNCLDIYGNLIWAMAKKFTDTREDAEKVTEAIFLDIWKCAEYYNQAHCKEFDFIVLIARRRLMKSLSDNKKTKNADIL